jgi:hypothetical protein
LIRMSHVWLVALRLAATLLHFCVSKSRTEAAMCDNSIT